HDGTLVVAVPSEMHRLWLTERVAACLANGACDAGVTTSWRFVVVDNTPAPVAPVRQLSARERDTMWIGGGPTSEQMRAYDAWFESTKCRECGAYEGAHQDDCSQNPYRQTPEQK